MSDRCGPAAATAAATATATTTVPQNRWDLVPPPSSPPAVSVVVPFFRQQAQLERLLAGIELQVGTASICEVVVADDGSPHPPVVPSDYDGPPVLVVRQPDHGVRPGAARNLGAASSTGDVLVFLDADMVPSSGYVDAVAALPSVAPEALVVGTRQHWDLEGWTGRDVRRWLGGTGPAPPRLEDPAWLAEGYRRSRDLLELDERSWQLVIGAVTTVHRSMFDELGGFDEGIDAYGAEDWDLAFRFQNAGALLAHVDAVAHHDGPDWRVRAGPDGVKNSERLHLVARVPSRTDPVLGSPAFTRIEVSCGRATEGAVVACVASALGSGGLSTEVVVLQPPGPCPPVLGADPRVRWGTGPIDGDDRFVVDLYLPSPVRLAPDTVGDICRLLAPGGPGRLVVADADGLLLVARTARATRRVARWAHASHPAGWADLFGPTATLDPSDLGITRLAPDPDLAEVFPR